jgi:phosphatidylglycerol:prolipoprotein diacylglycerol transferase
MYPVLIALGPLQIPTYGFLMAIGFLMAFNLVIKKAEIREININKLANLLFIILLFSILGSRFVYVALRWEIFSRNPLDIFKLWKGGMVFYGGLIAALTASLLYCRIASLPIGEIADMMAPSLALGHVFGRLGCFAYGCCYGHETTFCTGVHFPFDSAGVYRHPTQIYEAIAEFLIFLFLTFLYKHWIHPLTGVRGKGYRDGSLLLVYVVLYSTFRFFNEFFRGDNRGGQWLFGLSVSQNGALFLILVSVIMFLCFRLTEKNVK